MRSVVLGVLLLTVAALSVLVFSDGTVEILAFDALILVVVLLALRRRNPGPNRELPDFQFSRRRPSQLPPRLVDFERLVGFSQTAMFDFERRLLPKLREIADARLLEVHGFTSSDDPERAAGVLGQVAWNLLRPDRDLVGEVSVPGPSGLELDQLVTAIEGVRGDSSAPGVGFSA